MPVSARNKQTFKKLPPKMLARQAQNSRSAMMERGKNQLPSPMPGKSSQFYNSNVDLCIFGGAAGSGKSMSLLLDFAKPQYLRNPYYNAVIFRRTYQDITKAGGLWDESKRIYPLTGGIATQKPPTWRWEKGSSLAFAHLIHEDTVYEYQGAQINRIGFDELTHFSNPAMFWYMFTRARSMSGIKPAVRATCNPDADSWVAEFIQWYWNPETGYPIEERSGVVRYFLRRGDSDIQWASTKEELIDRYRDELELVCAKSKGLVTPSDLVKSFTFIAASVYDNPKLLEANPSYLAELMAQHPVERERLLHGNWKIRYEAGTVFSGNWFKIIDEMPSVPMWSVRFWDLAATAKEVADADACYTVGLQIAQIGTYFYIMDCIIEQRKAGDIEELLTETAEWDGDRVVVRWELEGASAGKMVEQSIRDAILERCPNHDAKACRPMGDKLTRALPAAKEAAAGRVFLLRGDWNDKFLNAVQKFDGGRKRTNPLVNDIVDAFSGGFNTVKDNFSYSNPDDSHNGVRYDVFGDRIS